VTIGFDVVHCGKKTPCDVRPLTRVGNFSLGDIGEMVQLPKWTVRSQPATSDADLAIVLAEASAVAREATRIAGVTGAPAFQYALQLATPMELLFTADVRTPPRIPRTRELYVAFELYSDTDLLTSARTACQLPGASASAKGSDRGLPTLHLAEAPGSFVDALLHLVGDADWHATSLRREHCPCFFDHLANATDRLNGHPRVSFGADQTGDLTSLANVHHTVREVGARHVALVTADGALVHGAAAQVHGAAVQRAVVGQGAAVQGAVTGQGAAAHGAATSQPVSAKLACAQTLVALRTLMAQGSFLLRLPDTWDADHDALLQLLHGVFQRVRIVRPQTLAPTQAVCFVVCCGFEPDARLTSVAMEVLTRHLEIHASVPVTWPEPCPQWRQRLNSVSLALVTARIAATRDASNLALYLQNMQLDTPAAIQRHQQTEYEHNGHVLREPRALIERIIPAGGRVC
jgi:biopolymer transport protein ExbD